jgi:twitching motility protein PilT
MDNPIYEIPAVQPGENVSWWDQIAATAATAGADADLTPEEQASAERSTLLHAAANRASVERANSRPGETSGHGFERRS